MANDNEHRSRKSAQEIEFLAEQIASVNDDMLGSAFPSNPKTALAMELQAGFLQAYSTYRAKYAGKPVRSKVQKKILVTLEMSFCASAILIHSPIIGIHNMRPFLAEAYKSLSPEELAVEATDILLEFYASLEAAQEQLQERAERLEALKSAMIDGSSLRGGQPNHTFSSSEGVWLIRAESSLPMPLYRLVRADDGSSNGYKYNLENDPLFEMPDYNRFLDGIVRVDSRQAKPG